MNILKFKGKPHVNVGTMGHIDHARSILAAAAVMSEWSLLPLPVPESKKPTVDMIVSSSDLPYNQLFDDYMNRVQSFSQEIPKFLVPQERPGYSGVFPKNVFSKPPPVVRSTRARRKW